MSEIDIPAQMVSVVPEYISACPSCGYSPLHHRAVVYSATVSIMYHCALCHKQFERSHEHRH